ncbi:Transposon Tf2-6 polyprotein [Labeo rohita]|uniref:Gypsy retrotransposon integrase-like protein 1 n=1 Tax=Labeo rohita TaxID=84645 RepID=A0ABQ8MX49_LABRO|nr:Transposon Tf2-6 polyprotein [Labeo rohita]
MESADNPIWGPFFSPVHTHMGPTYKCWLAGTITRLLSHYISHNPVPGISTSGSGSPRVHFPLSAIYRPPDCLFIVKCEFHLAKISFLGYVISSEGVAMDERKVNAVQNWPRPTTPKELQRFLGFSNFYRRFICHFSSVAAPLTAMVKRGTSRLTWSQPAIQAFNDLHQRFTTAPILHHPDPDRPFVVEVDASSTGVGAVLSQRQGEPSKMFPCTYFSHKLSPAERNYDVGNRKLLAIKLVLEEWRHWLEGVKHPFTVLTDHKNLEYLRSAKLLNHRQARWALFFTRSDFVVTYRPGSQNTKADALSRMHEPDLPASSSETILPTSMIVAPVSWDIMTEISKAQTQDPPPADCPDNLVYVPLSLRPRVLAEVHTAPSSGHPGIEATLHLLSNRFWWPNQRTDTIKFIRNCTVCSMTKVLHHLPAGLLQPLPVPQRPWSHIAVDFITDLPPFSGYTTILTVVDRFSKGCRLIPLSKLPTAMETAEVLCNWVFRFYGLPEDIVSNRGPQFSSRLWSSFFHLLGVNVSLTSGYHPQANGQVERLNQELTRFLHSYCHDRQEDWSREPSKLPAVNSWFQQSEETWNRAHVHLQSAIRRTETQANRRRRPNPPLRARTMGVALDPGPPITPALQKTQSQVPRWRSGRSGGPRRDRSTGTSPPLSLMARRFIGSIRSWTPGAGEVTSSIWSIGRASALRKDLGISLTPLSPSTSTQHTQIDQLPVGGVDPGVGHLLAPGVARGGGGSVTNAVSVAPSDHRQREPSPDF